MAILGFIKGNQNANQSSVMRALSFDISAPEWRDPETGDPNEAALLRVLKEHSDLLKPDQWFLLKQPKDWNYVAGLPSSIHEQGETLELTEAVGLIATGRCTNAHELETSLFMSIFEYLSGWTISVGDNYTSLFWLELICGKTQIYNDVLKIAHERNISPYLIEHAEVGLVQSLAAGSLTAYGIPKNGSNIGKYQAIPKEFFMYPVKVNHIKNSFYYFDGGQYPAYSALNREELSAYFNKEVSVGNMVMEWLEVVIITSDIQRLFPDPLSETTKYTTSIDEEEPVKRPKLRPSTRKPPYKQQQLIEHLKHLNSLPGSVTKDFVNKLRQDLAFTSLDDETVRKAIRYLQGRK